MGIESDRERETSHILATQKANTATCDKIFPIQDVSALPFSKNQFQIQILQNDLPFCQSCWIVEPRPYPNQKIIDLLHWWILFSGDLMSFASPRLDTRGSTIWQHCNNGFPFTICPNSWGLADAAITAYRPRSFLMAGRGEAWKRRLLPNDEFLRTPAPFYTQWWVQRSLHPAILQKK